MCQCLQSRRLEFFLSLSYGDDLGRSAASWHAAQRPGHVFKRYALDGCLGRGSRFGSVRTIGFGLGLPTWLLSVGATTVAYAGLTSVALSCRLLSAVGSLEVLSLSDPTSVSGVGRLLAGTVRLFEFNSSSAFLLPAMGFEALWEEEWASLSAPDVVAWRLISATRDVLALLHAAAFVLFFVAMAFLSSHKTAGESSTDEIALRKAISSCISIRPRAGGTLLLNCSSAPRME